MSSREKSRLSTFQRGQALAGFARRATIGSLFPSNFVYRKSKVHCPPIAELEESHEKQKDEKVELEEAEVDEKKEGEKKVIFRVEDDEQEEDDDDDDDDDDGVKLPTIKIVVPTDGSIPHLSEFISNYSQSDHRLNAKSKIENRRSSTIGLIGLKSPETTKEKLKRSNSMSNVKLTMNQLVEAFRRKSSLQKWFATQSISGRCRDKYDARRRSSNYDDYLNKMNNISRETLKFLLFPEKEQPIRLVRLSDQKFHDINKLTEELTNMRCLF